MEAFKKCGGLSLSNAYVSAEFNSNGLLQSITTLDDGVKTEARIEFITYGTRYRGGNLVEI